MNKFLECDILSCSESVKKRGLLKLYKREDRSISSYKNAKNYIVSGLLTFIFQHSLLAGRYTSPSDFLIFFESSKK